MDMRTKLVFALVAVALGSMLVFGAITFSSARTLLTNTTLQRLEGLTDGRKANLERLIGVWQDSVATVASGSTIRTALREYARDGSPARADRILEGLQAALGASATFEALQVFDGRGELVAFSARAADDRVVAPLIASPPGRVDRPGYAGVSLADDGEPRIAFVAPIVVAEGDAGVLRAVIHGRGLVAAISDRTGLAATGEVLVVDEVDGAVRVLHPLRGGGARSSEPRAPAEGTDPARLAAAGVEGSFHERTIDYRGEPVWAATRYLPQTGWGLIVKFDAEEEEAPILEFRQGLTRLGTSLAAFAILLGTLLGFRFGKPIHELAEVASRIRDGELNARASVEREDEIGLLARMFNQMTDELEQQMTRLHEYRRFFDMSRDMLCIANTDGFFKRVNPAFERTLGWSSDELLEKPFIDFVHPDDVEATLREVDKLAEGIPTISFENRFHCTDGSWKRLLWTSHPEPETGMLYAVAREIPELDESEARS